MITKFESTVKISFELSVSELQELFGALNSAEVAILQKRDDEKRSQADREYFKSVANILSDFVCNFNPVMFSND